MFSWAADIIQSTAGIKQEQELRKVNLLTIPIESRLVMQYRQAARRVIFLDYDGTLVPFSRIPKLAIPDVPTLRHLHLLAKDPKNRVFIISGRAKDFMEEWLGEPTPAPQPLPAPHVRMSGRERLTRRVSVLG